MWRLLSLLLAIVILLFAFLRSSQAQCTPWIGIPHWCSPVLNGSSVLMDDTTQSAIARKINATGILLNFGEISLECIEGIMNIVCHAAFPSCNTPPPCRESCERLQALCPAAWPILGLNCSASVPNTTSPIFPPSNPAQPGACQENWTAISTEQACAKPAIIYDESKDSCGVKCPAEGIYSDGQLTPLRLLNGICAVIGLIGNLFLFVSYSLIPDYRSRAVRWMALADLIYCAGISVVLAEDWENNVCAGPTDADVTEHPRAIVLGTLTYFGLVATSFWWMCIALNLYLRLNIKISESVHNYLLWAFHGLCWGVTAVSCIVLLAKKNTTSYSFINQLAGVDMTLNNIFIVGLLSFSAGSSFVLSIMIFVKIAQLGRAERFRGFVQAQLRLLLFVLFFLPLDIFVIAVPIWQQVGDPSPMNRYKDSYVEYLMCLASGVVEDCRVASKFPYGLFVAIVVSSCLQLLSPTLIFATSKRLMLWWRYFLQGLAEGQLHLVSMTEALVATRSSQNHSVKRRDDSIAASRRTQADL